MSELNTFIQFFAAIYLTITIDNLVFKRFWTPDLYSLVERKLKEFQFALSTPLNMQLMGKIRDFAVLIDRRARRRGGYMLLMCISTMIYTSFESYYQIAPEYYFAFFITLCCSFVGYFVGMFIFTKWKHVTLTYFVFVVIFVINIVVLDKTTLGTSWNSYFTSNSEYIIVLIKCVTIVFFVVPLLIRLFLNWLNSTVYINYLVDELAQEKDRYEKTIVSISTGNPSQFDAAYESAFKDAYFNQRNQKDQLSTNFAELLVTRIINICSRRSFGFLLCYLIRNMFKKNRKSIEHNMESVSPETFVLPVNEQTDDTYNELLREYEGIKSKKKLVDFCEEKKIEYEKFKDYRRKKLYKV